MHRLYSLFSSIMHFHLFNVHVIEMVLNKLNGGIKVSLVELIGNVPSQRSVLSPLLHSAVEKSHSIEHWLPLHHVANFQKVLVYTCKQYINEGISAFQQKR